MDWKPFVSSLLGVLTVVALHTEQAADFTKNGENMMPVLFVSILVVQVLFEILSKYYGKTCEFVDGAFTAMIVVTGYYMLRSVLSSPRMSGLTGGPRGGPSSFMPAPGDRFNQFGGAQTLGYIAMLSVGIGLILWFWKSWLKPKVMPSSCTASEPCPQCPPCPPCITPMTTTEPFF